MPHFLSSRRHVAIAAAVLLGALVLAVRFALPATAPPAPQMLPVSPLPEPRPAPQRFVVDVVGAVRRPGLYRLTGEARVADAVARAGGVTKKADLALVNLAAPLSDGIQIVIPRRGEVGAAAASGTSGAPTTGPVHLNGATLEQLDSLPGVGPVTAQKILDFRQKHGPFGSIDELDAIPGIGPARLDQLREAAAP